jgi:hypothetical protein
MARKLTAGETLSMQIKAEPLATVTVYLAGPAKKTIAAIESPAGSGCFAISADTQSWAPGAYAFEARQVSGGQNTSIKRGTLQILTPLDSIADGTDVRSTAAKAVANIEAMLSGTASLECRRYKINNRELERYSVAELLQLLTFWRRELSREERRNEGISTLGPRIQVRI